MKDEAADGRGPQEPSCQFSVESDMVIIRCVGPVDVDDFNATRRQAAEHRDVRPGMPWLYDVTRGSFTDGGAEYAEEVRALSAKLDEIRGPHATAIVVTQDAEFGLSRMLELMMNRSDDSLSVFREIDEAVAWLRAWTSRTRPADEGS